jgi:putative flippase GtrA
MGTRLAQPLKFLLVGTGGFVLNLCAFALLFGLGTWYLAASILAYLASNAAMYLGNRYFTFGLSHGGFVRAYVRYLVVGGVVAALTAVLLAAGVEGLGMDPRPAQALALLVLVPLSFVMSKRFAFQLKPVSYSKHNAPT